MQCQDTKVFEKWQRGDVEKEIARLQGLVEREMTLEFKWWLKEHINILKQMSSEAPEL
jgi:hypothetical protein